MVFLGEGGGGSPPPNVRRKGRELVKNWETTWSKLDLVYLYIKDFSVFKTIKKHLANLLTTWSTKWPTDWPLGQQNDQPIDHLVNKMTNHDI